MRQITALVALIPVVVLTACDDPNSFRIDPLLVEDTVELAAPTVSATLPSAVDISSSAGPILTRFPEREGDAERWDLTVRARNGELLLLPAGALGLTNPIGGPSAAAITAPLPESFTELIEAPRTSAFRTDSGVVAQVGAVYGARSRRTSGGFGACENFAKIQPLEVVPSEGRVRLRIVTNHRCNDPRLVPEE